MSGTIVAICISSLGGLPKYPQIQPVRVGTHGFVGDFHNRQKRPSFRNPGIVKENVDRHISVVAEEVLNALNEELRIALRAGSLAENILTRGLGDLSDIPNGARLAVGNGLILKVVEQNQPCKNLAPLHRLLVKRIYGRRGLLCAIEQGRGCYVNAGDTIEVLPTI